LREKFEEGEGKSLESISVASCVYQSREKFRSARTRTRTRNWIFADFEEREGRGGTWRAAT
jgi:hypothetical protein